MSMEYEPTIRRLPVYILIDCSRSMNGDAIESVNPGFRSLANKLLTDPSTCEIVWMSIIAYDSAPRVLVPLSPIKEYRQLPVKSGGCSNLGRAFAFLHERIQKEVHTQTREVRGDWRPLVFLMSDGKPTDEWESWNDGSELKVNLIACGVGSDVNVDNLRKMSSTVVRTKDLTREAFEQFIDFMSSTMTTASKRSDGISEGLFTQEELGRRYDKIILY